MKLKISVNSLYEHVFIILIIVISLIYVYTSSNYISKKFNDFQALYDNMIKRQTELQEMTKKFMDENEEFFIILDQFNDKFDTIINRQGKLGNVLGGIISENRKHDRKVAYILSRLGETVPDDFDPQNPSS